MAHVLIVSNSKELKAHLSSNQANRFDWEVIIKDSAIEAISMLQLLSDIEVVICKEVIGTDLVCEKICRHLMDHAKEYGREIPIVILGEGKGIDYRKTKKIPASTEWGKILLFANSLIPKKEKKVESTRDENKTLIKNFQFDEMFTFDKPIDEAVFAKENLDSGDYVLSSDGANATRIIMNKAVMEKLESLVEMVDSDKLTKLTKAGEAAEVAAVAATKAASQAMIVTQAAAEIIKKVENFDNLQMTRSGAEAAVSVASAGGQTGLPVKPPLKKELPIGKPQLEVAPPQPEGPEYVPVGIRYFLNMPDAPIAFDIYTKIKNGDYEEYVKKISANDKVEKSTVEQFIGSGLKDLYVHRSQYNKTIDSLNHQIISKYRLRNLPDPDKIQLNSDSYLVVLDLIRNMDINNYTAELISESMRTMKGLVRLPEALTVLISTLKEKKISYSYAHCHFTCVVMTNVVGNFSWCNKDTKDVLIYLCYFHDLGLHSDRLIKAHHYYQQEENNLTDDEKTIILKHAENAAKISGKILHTPFDLATLIREHHGIKTGIGYTEFLSSNVVHLCMVSIVVEEFVTCYLDVSQFGAVDVTSVDLKVILKALEDKYSMYTYLETVKTLKKLFIPSAG